MISSERQLDDALLIASSEQADDRDSLVQEPLIMFRTKRWRNATSNPMPIILNGNYLKYNTSFTGSLSSSKWSAS